MARFLVFAQAIVGVAGTFKISIGGSTHTVDERYVSYVIDPASLLINPPGKYPSYPYPVDTSKPLLRTLAAALSPSFFVITGGNSNCITYDGFNKEAAGPVDYADLDVAASETAGRRRKGSYMSSYCEHSKYYGSLKPELFDELIDFSHAVSGDFVWHLNMAFGRGYSSSYVPWDSEPARGLLARAATSKRPLAGAMLFEEVKSSKVGFSLEPKYITQDLAEMRKSLIRAGGPMPLVFGVLNQDSDQSPKDTDEDYKESADSVDVVCFSFYMNNAVDKHSCPYDPAETAKYILDAGHRAKLDKTVDHFVQLSQRLGKSPPHLTAGAPCTHSPEGTGWGGVNAHAGLLWYADALGRVAARGASVYARQTLFGGSYGLLDNTTYLPTPGYWVALLHKQLMGQTVLSMTSTPASTDVGIYGHCAKRGAGDVALLIANLGNAAAPLVLPSHSSRTEWLLEADALLSKKTQLNGKVLQMSASGKLPVLDGRKVPASSTTTIAAYSVLFTVMAGTEAGKASCSSPQPSPSPRPTPRPTPTPKPTPPESWDCRTNTKAVIGTDTPLKHTGDQRESCQKVCQETSHCLAMYWHKQDNHCHILTGSFSKDDWEGQLSSNRDYDSCFHSASRPESTLAELIV